MRVPSPLPLTVLLLALVGCRLNSESKDRCRKDPDCPGGQICELGRCLSRTPDADDPGANMQALPPRPDAGARDVPAADLAPSTSDAAATPDAASPDLATDLATDTRDAAPDGLPAGSRCDAGVACAWPNICLGSICQLKPLGSACSDAPECSARNCTDGRCCESQSCGPCRSCAVPGALGFCQPLPKSQRDAGQPGCF